MRRVLNPAQIRAAKAEGRRCLYLTANGVPLTGRQERTTEELGLVQRGRSDAEILKILGENVLRVAEATLQAGSGGAE